MLNRIDQSQFIRYAWDGIYFNNADKKFYFCDEITDAHGPFETHREALVNFEAYCRETLDE